ncbi:hypothetical protein ACLBPT_03240, partial [Klebsiella pneumoniae]|uniref:hypothetical protein n=1 Tax=Klebsiella pneumoniae TaxID=573 RepID=UPI003969FD3D
RQQPYSVPVLIAVSIPFDGFSCCYATTKQSSRLSEREMLRLACNDGRQDPEPGRLRRDRN